MLSAAAALVAVVALAASLAGVTSQLLPRTFTAAQRQAIMSWETAARWRAWPAARIFPAAARYVLPAPLLGKALPLSASRLGIAAQARCAAATDRPLARLLAARRCLAVLRASYADATGSFVATVGVAVLRGSAPAPGSLPAGNGRAPGVRAAAFPGTLAARFTDRQRQVSGAARYGPYLVLYTVGYADGRRDQGTANAYGDGEMRALGTGLARDVGSALGARPPVPRCPGAPGC